MSLLEIFKPKAGVPSSQNDTTTPTNELGRHPASSSEQNKRDVPSKSLRPLSLGSFVFDDGFNYPTLFEEADDMIKLSNLIYILAELRELARNGALNDHRKSLQILELPLPMDTALAIISAEAALLQEVLSDGKHGAALSAIQSLVQKQTSLESEKVETKSDGFLGGFMSNLSNCLTGNYCEGSGKELSLEVTASTIIAVGDEKCNEELVYVVGINPPQKRITVAFRGSVTPADFLTDAKIDFVQIADPRQFANENELGGTGYRDEELEKDICIHQGFHDYLFGKRGGNQSKFMEIMGHVNKLFDKNPERRNKYKLYVTGHSLGGALSTLFGFYASASGLPLPVTVVSVASPRVGNLAFSRTFTELESQGKIRHLRIANHKDPVTLGPTISGKRALTLGTMAFSPLGYLAMKLSGNEVGSEETYYHTGIKMKLRKEIHGEAKICELSYSGAPNLPGRSVTEVENEATEAAQESKGNSSFWKDSMPSDLPLVSYHYGTAYSERIALAEPTLKGLTLNKLYKEKTSGS